MGIDLEMMNAAFRDFVPHNKLLGLTLVEVTQKPASATLVLPWDDRLIGDPRTGSFHGGAITTLLDAACGAAVYVHLMSGTPIATLELRVDFLMRTPSRREVRARAECLRATADVAFVTARAWADDPSQPFALASATFALATPGKAVVP